MHANEIRRAEETSKKFVVRGFATMSAPTPGFVANNKDVNVCTGEGEGVKRKAEWISITNAITVSVVGPQTGLIISIFVRCSNYASSRWCELWLLFHFTVQGRSNYFDTYANVYLSSFSRCGFRKSSANKLRSPVEQQGALFKSRGKDSRKFMLIFFAK